MSETYPTYNPEIVYLRLVTCSSLNISFIAVDDLIVFDGKEEDYAIDKLSLNGQLAGFDLNGLWVKGSLNLLSTLAQCYLKEGEKVCLEIVDLSQKHENDFMLMWDEEINVSDFLVKVS